MALSMEERRILAQIEVRLSEDDPRLARRLAAFGGSGPPGPTARQRPTRQRPTRRTRLLAAVAVVAAGIATVIVTAVVSALT
jgi:hypothetical protein